MTQAETSFEHARGFEAGEVSGNVQLGRLEGYYEELFAEVIEDGIITSEERARLDRMADSLGLDRSRLRRLEQALQAAYEARHRVTIREEIAAPPMSLSPIEPATDARSLALERRIVFLTARIGELERELEHARAQAFVEVDLSGIAAPSPGGSAAPAVADVSEDATDIQRRLRHDPRDAASLRALFLLHGRAGDIDGQWCVASVLSHLGVANADEAAFHAKYRQGTLIQPKAALAREAWTRLLFHPEQEVLTGEIFAAVAPAVLMGRLSALRRDKVLPRLDPKTRQDPATSTIQAVRCFSWGAAILGMAPPWLHADPSYGGMVEMVPGIPPSTRIGEKALAGRSTTELAFLAGRHVAYHRAENFMRLLVPQIRDLEDIFLAALSIGNPGLPLSAQVKELVIPIAKAIEPILEPVTVDHLRGYFLRFLEEGGRTNLQRWATAVDRTAARAGFLLANDLNAAQAVLALEDAGTARERMDDLLVFVLSDRFAKLRRQIGTALEGPSRVG
jgi:hypothetical protein